MSAKYSIASKALSFIGVAMTIPSVLGTEKKFDTGQISNNEHLLNHGITLVGLTGVGFLAPISFELGRRFGPHSWKGGKRE